MTVKVAAAAGVTARGEIAAAGRVAFVATDPSLIVTA